MNDNNLTSTMSLPELAERINAEHRELKQELTQALTKGLQRAKTIGDLLLAAKSKAPHGAWRPFIKYHCPFSKRTASVYMRVAAHWPEIALKSAGSADLGIAQALRLLADHSDKEASPPH